MNRPIDDSSVREIRRSAVLAAPLERVWAAISDSSRFGHWFGAELDAPFVAGARVTGRIVPTAVDPEVAAEQEPYTGMPMVLWIDEVEPPYRLTFRWNPEPPEQDETDLDPDLRPRTSVTFELAEVDGGVEVTITESGFEALPADRRRAARDGNDQGWQAQLGLLDRYLAGPSEGVS